MCLLLWVVLLLWVGGGFEFSKKKKKKIQTNIGKILMIRSKEEKCFNQVDHIRTFRIYSKDFPAATFRS